MKHVVLAGVFVAVVGSHFPLAAQSATPTQAAPSTGSLGSVTFGRKVVLGGEALAAGTYQLRLSSELPAPVVGQSPESARYVEFLKSGKVVGREVATVVSNTDMATIAKWRKPALNSTKVETLKGDDYLRVWINRSGTNYLIHLPATT